MTPLIPSLELRHQDEKVFFAFRTMEQIYEAMQGQVDPPHRHEYFTVIFVKSACGSHMIDFTDFDMLPGMVFFVSPGQVHQVLVNNPNPKGDVIMFSPEFLTKNYISEEFISNLGLFYDLAGTPPIKLSRPGIEKLAAISDNIKTAFESDSVFKLDMIASYLKLFLIECNHYAPQRLSENPQALQSGKSLLKAFKNLLEKNYHHWHKVNQYAAALHTSPDYLNKVLKSAIGKTAKEYITNRLITEAKRLVIHTSNTNKEVAYALGFDDPGHFSKLFKKETGMAFTEFRKQLVE